MKELYNLVRVTALMRKDQAFYQLTKFISRLGIPTIKAAHSRYVKSRARVRSGHDAVE
jgi:hypothetical protein